MKDLLLWRLLGEPPAAGACELAELIADLGTLALADRLPFLGRIARFAAHPDPGMRLRVALALREADGPAAFRLLVALLSDEDAVVSLVALESLRRSAVADPARWAHALFHREPGIRRAAIEGTAPAEHALPALWLLADPVCRERATALLPYQRWHAHMLPVLFAAWRAGALDAGATRAHALTTLKSAPIPHLFAWCTDAQADAVVAAAEVSDRAVRDAAPEPRGLLGELLALGWEDPECGFGRPLAHAAEQAARAPNASTPPDDAHAPRRLAAAAFAAAAWRGTLPEWVAVMGAIMHPALLGAGWLDREARLAAAIAIFKGRVQAHTLAADAGKRLLKCDLVGGRDGVVDLRVAGAIARLVVRAPIRWLAAEVGEETLVRSFLAAPLASAPLLGMGDRSERGTKWLVEKLCARNPVGSEIAIVLLGVLPEDALGFLTDLRAGGALSVLEHFAAERAAAGELPWRTVNAAAVHLARALGRGGGAVWLARWVAHENARDFALGMRVLGELTRLAEPPDFALFARALPTAELRRFLEAVDHCARFPHAEDRRIAAALLDHEDPDVQQWCRSKLPDAPPPRPQAEPPAGAKLEPSQQERIARCDDAHLALETAPARARPVAGLTAALARRDAPVQPSAPVCAALLGCLDPIDQVARELARFGSTTRAFREELHDLAARTWLARNDLPLAAAAWLNRWERHAFRFAGLAMAGEEQLLDTLAGALHLVWPPLAHAIWGAARHVLGMWRWREPDRFGALCGGDLIDLLVRMLPGRHEEPAAHMLREIHAAGLSARLARVRDDLRSRLGDLDEEARALTASWLDTRGLATARLTRRAASARDEEIARRLADAHDLDALAALCTEDDAALVTEASLRLIELGERGAMRLAGLLARVPPPPAATVLAEGVGLWPPGPALELARGLARAPREDRQITFLVALVLTERGEDFAGAALEAAAHADALTWLREADLARLRATGVPEEVAALRLAPSPSPHAYLWAVRWLLAQRSPGERQVSAVRAFLELGTDRLRELRDEAACWLRDHAGDRSALPLRLAAALSGGEPALAAHRAVLAELEPASVVELAHGMDLVVLHGPDMAAQEAFVELLDHPAVDPVARAEALRVIAGQAHVGAREGAMRRLARSELHAPRVRELAGAFAWGILRGRELTGRMFRIEMIHEEHKLGWTVPGSATLHVNPLPVLRGLPHGRAIVEGLALHEVGHQLYHAGKEADAVREQAQRERLLSLLNLVADEHLERNLAARATGWRDRFRRLAAWAFMHNPREMELDELLVALGFRAFEVLRAAPPEVARQRGRLRVRGNLLRHLERAGSSFARFFRALRMGLGQRHGDPLVTQALALFGRTFRQSTMPELLEIARKLAALFPGETDLLSAFGHHEATGTDADALHRAGEGLTQEELDGEVERIVNPRRARERAGKGPARNVLNVGPAAGVNTITNVVRLAFDAAQHAELARRVARPARAFRRFLTDLGRKWTAEPHRIRGRRLDRAGLVPALIKRDPRLMVARTLQVKTDLFMAIVVDCSGSMGTGKNMERAHLFGALLAEAARGVPGIDVRLFGFTDEVIYDAGDARYPAVHALEPGGGNDDAAGLWHAARAAFASRRTAKLLVMVSDGLPTGCSVDTLRALVARLTHLHVCCAQVAVRRLEEICFPHHVVVDDADVDASVRKFGAIVAKLVKRTVAKS